MRQLPRAELDLDASALRGWPLPPHERADKRTRGTVLAIGGTAMTPGAIMLAGTAALRAGAGRLQLATDRVAAPMVAVAMPEALVVPTDLSARSSLSAIVAEADAVVVGPGLLDRVQAVDVVAFVLARARADAVVVVDACCISAVVADPALPPRRGRVVITPNRDELDDLLVTSDGERPTEATVAHRYGVVVASFGRVAAPDGRSWTDPTDVIGLGTSGAGDVLAGMVAGIGARCGDAAQAACWSTLTHRLAATRLSSTIAPLGYLARELCDEIPRTIAGMSPDIRSAPRVPDAVDVDGLERP
ncbi:MAG: ADP/ATP-dependent (S)-NAD(P)H-hydrate dehydratase [Ilumatobacteraceae bacterium]